MATSDGMDHSPARQDSSVADSVTELLSDRAHDRKRRKTESEPELVCVTDAARQDSIGAGSVEFTDTPLFFPVIAEPDLRTPMSLSLSLSGIRHETAHQSSGKLMSASPILDYLPPPPPNCRLLRHDIIASSNGLLLVKALSVSLMAPDHTWRQLQGNACYRCKDFHLGRKWDWESLTVINPLTKQFWVLPAFKGESLKGWTTEHRHGVQAQIMVDAEANSYKVLYYKYTWRLVYVYESKSDIWQRVYHRPIPLPKLGGHCISATLQGRLYFADIREATDWEVQRNPGVSGVVRLFEMDIVTGHWTASKGFPLCKSHDQRILKLGVTPEFDFNKNVLSNWELVECMGHPFAVIPARLDEELEPLHFVRARLWIPDISALDFEYIMPLQFYIFELEGEEGQGLMDLYSGVLRIELPRNISPTRKQKRQLSLYEKTSGAREPAGVLDPRPNWFSCTARGSVIWVSFEDYLLQYDVKSGQSKTQLLPKRRMQRCDRQMRLAYRPSFHMKP